MAVVAVVNVTEWCRRPVPSPRTGTVPTLTSRQPDFARSEGCATGAAPEAISVFLDRLKGRSPHILAVQTGLAYDLTGLDWMRTVHRVMKRGVAEPVSGSR